MALAKAVIAHAARWAERQDVLVAVFGVRRAYFYVEEKRDIFVELPDYVPAEIRATHVGKLRKALYGTRPVAASWRDELRKGLFSCCLTDGTVSRCCFRQCTVMNDMTLKKRWETRNQMIGARPDVRTDWSLRRI